MTPLRKTALVAGVFYLITFISIPTLLLYGNLKTVGLHHQRGPQHRHALGASWR